MAALVELVGGDIGRPADFAGSPLGRQPVFNQARLGRGAAHIERQDLVQTGLLAQPGRSQDPGRRPGFDHKGRFVTGQLGRHDPAVGLHDQQPLAVGRQVVFETVQIAVHDRNQRGVNHGRAGPLILPDLGVDVGRNAHHRAGAELIRNQPRHLLFVGRVKVGVDQTHGNGLDLVVGQTADDLTGFLGIQRALDRSVAQNPFAQLQTQLARHSGRPLTQLGSCRLGRRSPRISRSSRKPRVVI